MQYGMTQIGMKAPQLTIEKIEELQALVRSQLLPLITDDYVLLDLPYYDNPGDTLIWEGTLNFLKELPFKNLYSTGKDNYVSPRLRPGMTILLQGGGNFGDLWPEHRQFRKRVIEEFPDNPVVVLPQSVHYQDEANLREDVEFFKKHPNVVICVRDRRSQQILEKVFPNRILLVPDMAFFLEVRRYRRSQKSEVRSQKKVLLAARLDKEAPADVDMSVVPPEAETHDWPTVERYPSELYAGLDKLHKRCRRLKKWTGIDLARRATDWFYLHRVRPHHVKTAVDFIDAYDEVWSTRLHITILAMLLGKEVHVLDNNYAKTRNLLETWFV